MYIYIPLYYKQIVACVIYIYISLISYSYAFLKQTNMCIVQFKGVMWLRCVHFCFHLLFRSSSKRMVNFMLCAFVSIILKEPFWSFRKYHNNSVLHISSTYYVQSLIKWTITVLRHFYLQNYMFSKSIIR